MFLTLFLVGALGFLAMTFLGVGRIGGHSSSHSGSHAGSGHASGAGHAGVGHAHPGAQSGHHAPSGGARVTSPKAGSARTQGSGQSNAALRLLASISPLEFFTYCLGFGATDLLLQSMAGSWTLTVAIIGALVFNFVIVKPLMSLLVKYQTPPSIGLEGTVANEAEALSTFDPQGRGLVRLTLDGQLVQLLATLESTEHHRGVVVSKGDKVVILEVDATKNQCRVSRDLVVA
jgi:hypothetical protein